MPDTEGWAWREIRQSIEPVIADVDMETEHFSVRRGQVRAQARKLVLTALQGRMSLS